MKVVDIKTIHGSVIELLSQLDNDILVLTANHEPVAFLVPATEVDREELALSLSPDFMAIINKARTEMKTGKKLSLDDMKKAVLDAA